MLAATPDGLVHARFADLPRFLAAGDLLVVNTSATVAAAVPGHRGDGRPVLVHWSGRLPDGGWLVELRAGDPAVGRVTDAAAGETVTLPDGGSLTLLEAYPGHVPAGSGGPGSPHGPARPGTRIWAAAVTGDVAALQARHGQPVRYSYVPGPWPLSAYQTVFARSPGSAEMPSAARPFTPGLVTDLVSAGVLLATVTLHAGVASLEEGEPPLPEWFTVPQPTADLVNLTRAAGRRVVAVGTTSTRALESAADAGGQVRASSGLGQPGARPGPAGPGRHRADHWLARRGRLASRAAGRGGRPGPGPGGLRGGRPARVPVARVRRQLPAAAAGPWGRPAGARGTRPPARAGELVSDQPGRPGASVPCS